MKLSTLLLALSLAVFWPAPLIGGDILSVEDILSMKTVQSPVFSADGLRIVFTVTEPASEELSKTAMICSKPNLKAWLPRK